jgi:hypothetical protein
VTKASIGNSPHQAHFATAIDQLDTALGQDSFGFIGRLRIRWMNP